ncbi:MAG: DUF58 domain-containing protein [Propionibacteriaceae bacterium]|nr:DUF58 domain-containing protein [Propionibacteriaceae bacterium]
MPAHSDPDLSQTRPYRLRPGGVTAPLRGRRDKAPSPPPEARPVAKPRPRGARRRKLALRLHDWFWPYRAAARPVIAPVARLFGAVSRLGWTVLVLCAASWFAAFRFGWTEAATLAAMLLVTFAVACLFVIGRQQLAVSLDIDPLRVRVGESVAARCQVTNTARGPMLPLGLEFPVGLSVARFTLPGLGAGASHDEVIVIPTSRRGVITIGPVVTQRGDPFGLVRREVTWAQPQEVFVHPRTVMLEPAGSGLLRDLEGYTTNDISMSDLAFHTLRDYVPGDDRRYIHWRSSAKLSGASGASRFLVRQFLDTRRSHIAVVVDVAESSYHTPEEFELAVSVGASIALRAITDEMDLTVVCGGHAVDRPPPYLALDTFSRAEYQDWDLPGAVGQLNRLSPDASVVILVSGGQADFADFLRARAYLSPEVTVFAVSANEEGGMNLQQSAGITVLTVGRLADLPKVLRGVQVQ